MGECNTSLKSHFRHRLVKCSNRVIFSGDDLTWWESELSRVAKIPIWIPLKRLKRGWLICCWGERTAQFVHSKGEEGGKNLQLSGETSEMIRGRRECGSAREAVIHISATNQRRRHCCSEEKRRIHPKRAQDGEEKSIFDFLTVKLFMETFNWWIMENELRWDASNGDPQPILMDRLTCVTS